VVELSGGSVADNGFEFLDNSVGHRSADLPDTKKPDNG
jgi:hypothetical protein